MYFHCSCSVKIAKYSIGECRSDGYNFTIEYIMTDTLLQNPMKVVLMQRLIQISSIILPHFASVALLLFLVVLNNLVRNRTEHNFILNKTIYIVFLSNRKYINKNLKTNCHSINLNCINSNKIIRIFITSFRYNEIIISI